MKVGSTNTTIAVILSYLVLLYEPYFCQFDFLKCDDPRRHLRTVHGRARISLARKQASTWVTIAWRSSTFRITLLIGPCFGQDIVAVWPCVTPTIDSTQVTSIPLEKILCDTNQWQQRCTLFIWMLKHYPRARTHVLTNVSWYQNTNLTIPLLLHHRSHTKDIAKLSLNDGTENFTKSDIAADIVVFQRRWLWFFLCRRTGWSRSTDSTSSYLWEFTSILTNKKECNCQERQFMSFGIYHVNHVPK